jgi:hypothetical protein
MDSVAPRSAISAMADGLLDELPVLIQRLVERIGAEVDSYREAATVTPEDLRQSCLDNVSEMICRLSGRPPNPEAPLATGRRRAEQGFPLADVLHAFRLGGRVIWEALVEHARKAGPDTTAELVDVAGTLWAAVDSYSVLVASAYQQRTSELSRLDAERRALVVDAVLAGLAAENPSLPEAAAALGLPLHGSFLAVSADQDGAAPVERVVDDELRGRGGSAVWRLRTGRYLGIVSLGPTATASALRAALEEEAGVRVGLSPLYPELSATPEALRLADVARATLPPGTAGVTAYDDHPVRSLVANDADAGRRAARVVLDSVLDLDPETRVLLLDTLRAWIAAGGSTPAAAEALYCHRNTVRNRLQRLEELTGRSLEDPRGLAELFVASEALGLLGPLS